MMSTEKLTVISQEIVENVVQDETIANDITERTPLEALEIAQAATITANDAGGDALERDILVSTAAENLENAGLIDDANVWKDAIVRARIKKQAAARTRMRHELQSKFGIGRIL